ncbi:TPM domain-containing protein [Oceanobacillus sp. FSL H7-0719]|uniref:TPM domain-containing protein n=1 Tax=Oceanobacillus sp. FSL H7-0719 TaxID=2954507 RepID=UPI00324F5F94
MMQLLRQSILCILFFLFLGVSTISADVQRIYDDANLLTDEEIADLEEKAAVYYDEWKTDFIVITSNDADGKHIKDFMGDFTDDLAEQFDRAQDNMVVITMNMKTRDFYVSGFGIGKKYLDDKRIDDTVNKISPFLSKGDYYKAFDTFFDWTENYLGVSTDINPNSLFFNTFVQLAIAIGLAGLIVFFMAYSSGGRVTVTNNTYMDHENTRVVRQHDRFIRKTVTKRKKPSNNSSGGGRPGGGGGMTGGGRSYSGGGGKF